MDQEGPAEAMGRRDITKDELRAAIHGHLTELGFRSNGDGYSLDGHLCKAAIRELYAANRSQRLGDERGFLERHGDWLECNLASGRGVCPSAIKPELVEILGGTPESDLFRLATLLWSVPVSRGFGRRMRFLVRDSANGKLIGVFALGSPVFNLAARDRWIGWASQDRERRLVHVMDAFVVGAVPPYSQLIGGKLVAALMASREVMQAHRRKYARRHSVISGQVKRAQLLLLTTTSALGRSSLYNRLRVPDGPQVIRIGTTRGFGHFHLSGSVFALMRRYLAQEGHRYASGHRFGMGPNWRMRVARAALEDVGLDADSVLNHGVLREVYAIPLAANCRELLCGSTARAQTRVLPAGRIADYCLARWVVPRASRDPRFRRFSPQGVVERLLDGATTIA